MSHSATALILHCIDFRFVHETVHFMKQQGLIDQYDDVGAAGAAKNLADPSETTDREFILRQIEIAVRLHGIRQVYLVNHRDCGAYGQIFSTSEAETARHAEDLRAAEALVLDKFPKLGVKKVLATLAAPGRVTFEVL